MKHTLLGIYKIIRFIVLMPILIPLGFVSILNSIGGGGGIEWIDNLLDKILFWE